MRQRNQSKCKSRPLRRFIMFLYNRRHTRSQDIDRRHNSEQYFTTKQRQLILQAKLHKRKGRLKPRQVRPIPQQGRTVKFLALRPTNHNYNTQARQYTSDQFRNDKLSKQTINPVTNTVHQFPTGITERMSPDRRRLHRRHATT